MVICLTGDLPHRSYSLGVVVQSCGGGPCVVLENSGGFALLARRVQVITLEVDYSDSDLEFFNRSQYGGFELTRRILGRH